MSIATASTPLRPYPTSTFRLVRGFADTATAACPTLKKRGCLTYGNALLSCTVIGGFRVAFTSSESNIVCDIVMADESRVDERSAAAVPGDDHQGDLWIECTDAVERLGNDALVAWPAVLIPYVGTFASFVDAFNLHVGIAAYGTDRAQRTIPLRNVIPSALRDVRRLVSWYHATQPDAASQWSAATFSSTNARARSTEEVAFASAWVSDILTRCNAATLPDGNERDDAWYTDTDERERRGGLYPLQQLLVLARYLDIPLVACVVQDAAVTCLHSHGVAAAQSYLGLPVGDDGTDDNDGADGCDKNRGVEACTWNFTSHDEVVHHVLSDGDVVWGDDGDEDDVGGRADGGMSAVWSRCDPIDPASGRQKHAGIRAYS